MNPSDIRILHVEDEDLDVEALARSFAKMGIGNEIVVARDGIEALEILRGGNGREALSRPFVILLDLNLPRMNGLEFLEELRGDPALSDIVVFVLTTSESPRDIRGAHEHHVAGYITKDNAGRQFLDLVTQIDGYWKIAELPSN